MSGGLLGPGGREVLEIELSPAMREIRSLFDRAQEVAGRSGIALLCAATEPLGTEEPDGIDAHTSVKIGGDLVTLCAMHETLGQRIALGLARSLGFDPGGASA